MNGKLDVTLHNLLDTYQRFRRSCCCHLQGSAYFRLLLCCLLLVR